MYNEAQSPGQDIPLFSVSYPFSSLYHDFYSILWYLFKTFKDVEKWPAELGKPLTESRIWLKGRAEHSPISSVIQFFLKFIFRSCLAPSIRKKENGRGMSPEGSPTQWEGQLGYSAQFSENYHRVIR